MTTTILPDPWRLLAERAYLRLEFARLPPGFRGVTDGSTTIWLSRGLSQRERRCVLMHELVHVERGHVGHQPPSVEAAVREETARRMLPDLHLVANALADQHPAEAAHDLWVTDDILRTRLAALTDEERQRIEERIGL